MSDLYDDDIVEWSERQADLLRRRAAGKLVNDADNALHVLGDLKKRGVSLHMIDLGGDVTGNGISKLVCTILSAVAEAERDRTRERISEVKADQRKRGRFLGGSVPFGWRRDKEGGLVPEAGEQAAIGRMRALRDDGLSLRAIRDRMAVEGVRLSHVGVGNGLRAGARP